MEEEKRFIIKFCIFVLALILVTGVGIYFTIKYLNKEETPIIKEETISKPSAEDSKYGIKSYTETYDMNSINVTKYIDVDGIVKSENDEDISSIYGDSFKTYIEYIQIDGLLDETVKKKINDRLKQEVYNLKCSDIYSSVTANFANVLSVQIYGYIESEDGLETEDKYNSLNIDLFTGDDIPLDKVFVSSAPLNSYLTEGLFETLGWEKAWEEENDGTADMDKVDTSEYEDKALMLLNNYKKQKENINYNIYPDSVVLWNVIDKNIIEADYIPSLTIDFINHKEEVAIYKRYLRNESIYKQDSIGTKNIIVLTKEPNYDGEAKNISYGKIEDNIFIEDTIIGDNKELGKNKELLKYFETRSEEAKQNLRNQDFTDKGVFYQRQYWLYQSEDELYYSVNECICQTTCDISYFKEDAFEDYVKVKNMPRRRRREHKCFFRLVSG